MKNKLVFISSLTIIFTLIFSVGCSLHGGRGFGPDRMTIRTSIPTSVFIVNPNLRSELRSVETSKLNIKFGDKLLDFERQKEGLYFFSTSITKALVQNMVNEGKVNLTLLNNGVKEGKVIEVKLDKSFTDYDFSNSTKQTASIMIYATNTGVITGAKTISITELSKVSEKETGELLTDIINISKTSDSFVDILLKDKEEDTTGDIIKAEEARNNNPVEPLPYNNSPIPSNDYKTISATIKTYESSPHLAGEEIKDGDTVTASDLKIVYIIFKDGNDIIPLEQLNDIKRVDVVIKNASNTIVIDQVKAEHDKLSVDVQNGELRLMPQDLQNGDLTITVNNITIKIDGKYYTIDDKSINFIIVDN